MYIYLYTYSSAPVTRDRHAQPCAPANACVHAWILHKYVYMCIHPHTCTQRHMHTHASTHTPKHTLNLDGLARVLPPQVIIYIHICKYDVCVCVFMNLDGLARVLPPKVAHEPVHQLPCIYTVYIYIYIHTHIHIYTYIYIHTYIYVCVYICMYRHVYIHM